MVTPTPPAASDRRQLQQIIAGLTDGVILIDPDQSISWANTAALAMHGVSDLSSLGETVDDYRAKFQLRYRNNRKLTRGHTPIERVVAGETFRDVTVEVTPLGKAEPEWTHQVRSLVLTTEAGEPDCLVLIIHDVTERFEAEERFESSFNVNPAPALICRLKDKLFIKVNRGFLELTGYDRLDVIGRSLHEIDVLAESADAEANRARLMHGEPLPQTEAHLHLPDGRKKAVIVAGQPIEIGGCPCMMFTFMDLDPRRSAEEELRSARAQSHANFESLYNEAPVPLHSLDAAHRLVTVSDRWLELLGYSRDEVISRPVADFMSLSVVALAKDEQWNRLFKKGVMRDQEYEFVKKTGDSVSVSMSARVVLDDTGGVERTMAVLIDITDRKHTEERFEKTFELAPIAMIVAQLDAFTIISANRAFLEMVGRALGDTVGRSFAQIGAQDGSAALENFDALLGGLPAIRDHPMTILTAAGALLHCLVSADKVVILGQNCALLAIQDVTERRQSEAQLFDAIEAVMQDTTWFSRSVIDKLLQLKNTGVSRVLDGGSPGPLTNREREIVGLISQGKTNAEICKVLALSTSTIRNHVASIYGKLGVHNRSAAVVWARERGILGMTVSKKPGSARKS